MSALTATPGTPVFALDIQINAGASGGTSPYTYQWYASTISPSTGYATISGATAATLSTATLSDTIPSYVKCTVTDNVSATATSGPTTVDPLAAVIVPGSAVVSIGQYSNISGTLTHRQSGNQVKYYFDVAKIPNPSTAVRVVMNAYDPVSGENFFAVVTTSSDGHGTFATYTTNGLDFRAAGTWKVALAFVYNGGDEHQLRYIPVTVS